MTGLGNTKQEAFQHLKSNFKSYLVVPQIHDKMDAGAGIVDK
jgi:hypothetical protein